MTLEEAIRHCEEVAERCAVTDGNLKCEMEHRQLAEWLRELKELRELKSVDPCDRCRFTFYEKEGMSDEQALL